MPMLDATRNPKRVKLHALLGSLVRPGAPLLYTPAPRYRPNPIDLAGGHKMTDDEIREALRLDLSKPPTGVAPKLPSTQRTVETWRRLHCSINWPHRSRPSHPTFLMLMAPFGTTTWTPSSTAKCSADRFPFVARNSRGLCHGVRRRQGNASVKLGSADAEAACTGEGWACHRAVSREILLGIGNDRQDGHNRRSKFAAEAV